MNIDDLISLMPDDPFKGDKHLKEKFIDHLHKEKKMSNKIGHQDVTDFTKLLICLGDILDVDVDYFILNKTTKEKILVTDRDQQDFPVKIYHNNRVAGNHFVLNLFKETKVPKPEHKWFFEFMIERMCLHMFLIMDEIIDLFIEKEKDPEAVNDKFVKLANYIELTGKEPPNEKTKKEIRKIDKKYFIDLFYDSSAKTGEIQSHLFDEECQTKYTSITKKTWDFINDIYESLFNGGPDSIQELFVYTPTTINAPRCETHIILGLKFYDRIKEVTDLLKIVTTDIEDYKEHCRLIEGYQRMAAWDDGLRSKTPKVLSPEVGVPSSVPNLGGVPDLNKSRVPDLNKSFVPDIDNFSRKSSIPDLNTKSISHFGLGTVVKTGKVPDL